MTCLRTRFGRSLLRSARAITQVSDPATLNVRESAAYGMSVLEGQIPSSGLNEHQVGGPQHGRHGEVLSVGILHFQADDNHLCGKYS